MMKSGSVRARSAASGVRYAPRRRIDGRTSSNTQDSNLTAAGSLDPAISRYRSPSVMNRACWTPPGV
ncbi:hypothetical protein [Propionibacterium acidifaciens]|uniref:hypothetical protein n=1 Tax=Propionibacterium acidifaciens TaxID=556499 RepID=UPI0028DBFC02|nr:hypothetical protein [Propionibacterium acidifaciens]